jgi:hypothetical protein
LVDQLVAAGRAEAARGDVLELGPPLRPTRGATLPSKALAAQRDEER